ncbi:fumarylacetoacetate hydrolase [Aquibacillus halophilus]|uniref:Fumarylacetoacetate hydrolase n=1 Tax=Aquibacillus halophilus TaxID=930132 RepID=A0A6A8DKN6_9BACI|nr:fumarylacetoacetate hydrolase family protein [Aquibacillus halophilus]MRH44341.1 fumarylacetoacetate hydrolase [Aquibacillus halophilus]
MRLSTVKIDGVEQVAIVEKEKTILVQTIIDKENKDWSYQLFDILQKGQLNEIAQWYESLGKVKLEDASYQPINDSQSVPLYRHPNKIIGVGFNYMDKAVELTGEPPMKEPVIFIKPDTSLIGPGESIELPKQSNHVTAEGELALVIGKTLKNVSEQDAINGIAGFTTSLDMTAKDIHAEDPRFLQRSKSFDTFFSLGDQLLTVDEFLNINEITVKTSLNGKVTHGNKVGNMMYSPAFIVSFLSQVMTLYPGDIVLTGTPGSVTIKSGDVPGCQISNFTLLENNVVSGY